jgi:hypothetical protein
MLVILGFLLIKLRRTFLLQKKNVPTNSTFEKTLHNEKIKHLQDSNDNLKIRTEAQEVTIKRLSIELDASKQASFPHFTPFQLLGVVSSSSLDDLKKQYRKLAQLHHPDHGTDGVMLTEINKAYQKIKK